MIVALSAGRDAPAELRSRLALDDQGQKELLSAPRPGVAELVVLSTCHRTELYATGDGVDGDLVHAVAGVMPGLLPTDHSDMRLLQGSEAIEHLFRVACGLDSLVIGEPQVLGQVRRALVIAQEAEAAGPVLTNIFGRAIRLGRRARAQTGLGRLGQSIGSIAADYLSDRFNGVQGRRVAVIGSGEAASDAAKSLWKANAQVSLVSRTLASAERVVDLVEGASAFPIEQLNRVLDDSELALVAVSGGLLLKSSDIPSRTADEPYLVLDLSVPAAVETSDRADVEIRTLEEIPGPRGPEITEAVIDAEAMVKKEVADLQHWADTRASGPAIQDLRTFAEQLVQEEISRSIGTLGLTPEQRSRIEQLGMRIANKLLHGPTTQLRRSDEATRTLIRKIFHLD